MKEWRVIAVLFAIILLLSVILGIKIMNNTPEKQLQQVIAEEEKKDDSSSVESEIENEKEKIFLRGIESYEFIMLIIIGIFYLLILLMIIAMYKLCFKLGINSNLIWSNIILNIITGFVLNISIVIGLILTAVNLVLLIIIISNVYKTVGVNPLLLLLGFIPIVGSIAIIIVWILGTCKLADCFRKGIGFKLGLILLPFIFYPILAFSRDE